MQAISGIPPAKLSEIVWHVGLRNETPTRSTPEDVVGRGANLVIGLLDVMALAWPDFDYI